MRIGKKELHHTFAWLSKKLFNRKSVIIYSPGEHQSIHLNHIIKEMLNRGFSIYPVGIFSEETIRTKVYSSFSNLPIWLNYDLVVSTEISPIPWWLTGRRVFFGHGVGPKMDYQSNKNLANFEFSFAPCVPIFNAHCDIVKKVYPVGLPILEDLSETTPLSTSELAKHFHLDLSKPLIIYAPSWNRDHEYISDIIAITDYLAQQKGFNLVISPHPNLLNPQLCGGIDYFSKTELNINTHSNTGLSTLKLCGTANLVVSDISSILFESLALNKKVVWDCNIQVYLKSKAEELIPFIKNNCIQLDLDLPAAEFEATVNRWEITTGINSYIFNINAATKSFVDSVNDIISSKDEMN